METTPYQLYDREESVRAYGEFMSGQFAWDYDVRPDSSLLLRAVIGN